MTNKAKLTVIEGHRDNLENQISHALFTIFDQEALDKKLEEVNKKLAPKGQLRVVSDTHQILPDEH